MSGTDPVELIARAICAENACDPDYRLDDQSAPYWEVFVAEAEGLLAAESRLTWLREIAAEIAAEMETATIDGME